MDSLRFKIQDELRDDILEKDAKYPTDRLLYNLVMGNTNTVLTIGDIISAYTNAEDPKYFIIDVVGMIIFLVSDYSFFHVQMVDFVHNINSDKRCPDAFTTEFNSQFVMLSSDGARSNYAHLHDEPKRTKDLVEAHINLHQFFARLLPMEGLVELEDVLYTLSVGLEDHSDSHNCPDIDVPVAALYVIHGAEQIKNACRAE